MARHSTLCIDEQALKNNFNVVKSYLFDNQEIMAVVKANAYGVGVVRAAQIFIQLGVEFLGVACIEEAVQLRESGFSQPILVLSPFYNYEIPLYLKYEITPTITDEKRAKELNEQAVEKDLKVNFHFKVDTGMGRLGPHFKDAKKIILNLMNYKNIQFQGLFSHFPSADLLDDFCIEQILHFKDLIHFLEEQKISVAYKHISNSSGIIEFNDPFFNLVRPGILLYGTYPSREIAHEVLIKHVVSWKSNVIEVKKMKKGQTISYGRTYKLDVDKTIGVIPVGYADGFSTLNSNNGFVYVKNKKCSVLGRVCMDYFMVDASGIDINVGDEVEIYGDKEDIKVENVAKRTGLISYEILTNINYNTKREYIS